MKQIFTLLMLVMLSIPAYAQTEDSTFFKCGTEDLDSASFEAQPWYGDSDFILNYVDSVENSLAGKSTQANTLFMMPVTAWVHHQGTALSDNISDYVVEDYINRVNYYFAATGSAIRFFIACQPIHVTNSSYYNVSASTYNAMFDNHYSATTMNIHFPAWDANYTHRGRFPGKNKPYACYLYTENSSAPSNIARNAPILAHEIGHALGLSHTHQPRCNAAGNVDCGNCYQESVSRTHAQGGFCVSSVGKTKCSINGDALCDTDADPLLAINGTRYVNAGCNQFVTAGYPKSTTDNWGNGWLQAGANNALINIMSYTNPHCMSQYTPSQRGVQYFWIFHRNIGIIRTYNSASFFINPHVDLYEGDNHFENAQTLLLSTPQTHTFHASPSPLGQSTTSTCDKDFVTFTPSSTGFYKIETSAVTGKPNANTRLVVYSRSSSGTLVQLAAHSNISTTNHYSSISVRLFGGVPYYIAVEDEAMSWSTDGYYSLSVVPISAPGGGSSTSITGGNPTFRLAPNPATTSVTVTAEPSQLLHRIILYNNQGIIMADQSSEAGVTSLTINTSAYQPGTYTVYAYNGTDWDGEQLVIQ